MYFLLFSFNKIQLITSVQSLDSFIYLDVEIGDEETLWGDWQRASINNRSVESNMAIIKLLLWVNHQISQCLYKVVSIQSLLGKYFDHCPTIASTVVKAMTTICPPCIDALIQDCRSMAKNFRDVRFSHVCEKANMVAHRLAGHANMYPMNEWWDDPPDNS